MDSLGYLLVCCALLATWSLAAKILAAYRPGLRQVPGPWLARFTNIWRVTFLWDGQAHTKFAKLHDKYGAIVRTGPNSVDLSDPSMISVLYGIGSKYLKTEFYSTLAMIYEDKTMNSMFSTRDPEEHRLLKRPVAQKFSMTSIRTLEYLVDPCTDIFIQSMMDLQGGVVDFGVWLQWYAFDVIGAITFNKRFGFMEQRRDVNDVISGIEVALRYAGIVGQVPYLHPYLLGSVNFRRLLANLVPGFKDPVYIVMKMVEESIAEYEHKPEEHGHQRGDFLAYLRQEQKSTGERISNWDLMNHLMNNLLAGSDTTAISLRAVFYYLLHDGRVYRALQQEIDKADMAGKLSPNVTYLESLELEYLQLCLKEAMRMHPGVSFPLERLVPGDGATLCGVHLPGGTIVGMNPATIHRDRRIFGEDADVFRPERWQADVEKVKEMERALLSFGAGVRTCIGKNISIMEMGKFVPQIMRRFDLYWAASDPQWKVSTFWFARQTGMMVRLVPRARN